jgi:hypothetical protein
LARKISDGVRPEKLIVVALVILDLSQKYRSAFYGKLLIENGWAESNSMTNPRWLSA